LVKETITENEENRISRERLYREVWAEPMTTVAQKYKVSSSFLARVCTRLNVPRPHRGYWARLVVGRKSYQPPLPEAAPGDAIEWARYGQARCVPPLPPKPPEGRQHRRRKRGELPVLHPLLVGMRELMNEGRETYSGYTKPKKWALPDVIASKDAIDRALDVANELFLLCEARNCHVMFPANDRQYCRHSVDEREKPSSGNHYSDLWSPSRATVVFIGTVAFGLTIFEMSENAEVMHVDDKYIRIADITPQMMRKYSRTYTWRTTKEIPSGRFCLQAYSPYQQAKWMRQWREAKQGDFPPKFKRIIKELEAEAASIAMLYVEGKRKEDIEREKQEANYREWQTQEAMRRQIQARKDSREDLLKIIERWAEVKRIEEFFNDAERRVADIGESEKDILMERLKLARELIGSTDALDRLASWKTPEERTQKH
jgi:hypothetical protein